MKLNKLATLMATGLSCAYLTQCTTPVQISEDGQSAASPLIQKEGMRFAYPETRTHQAHLDKFLHGEFGIPANVQEIKNANFDTPKPDDGIDHYATETIVDKYRWLEDYDPIDPNYAKETSADRERNFIGTRQENDEPVALAATKSLQTVDPNRPSSEVNNWVNAQNEVTENYIKQAPFYEQLVKNTNSLYNREVTISRAKRSEIGEIRQYRGEDGFRRIERIDVDGTVIPLFNERSLSENGKSAIRGGSLSTKGTYYAFYVRTGSADSDAYSLHVINTTNGEYATPIINRIYRSDFDMEWIDDDSFYYTAYDEGWRSLVYRRDIGKERYQDPIEVALHHVEEMNVKALALDGTEEDENRYLIMDTWLVGDSVYIKDLKTNKVYRLHNQAYYNKEFARSPAFNNEILAKLVHFDPKTRDVWIISGENDPKGEIIKTNLDNLHKREVVVPAPKDYDITRDAYYHEEGNGYFLVSYLQDGISRIVLIDATTAQIVKDLTPPQGAGYVSKLSGHIVGKDDQDDEDQDDEDLSESFVKFRYSNPTMPDTDFKYSIAKDEFIDIRRFDLSPFDQDKYETKLVFYTSYDGTKVPMNISYKKGIKLDGKNPTLMYGYGGYGVIYDQAFGFPANTIWLENGGVWAHAMIRGGGEYGKAWQKAAQHKDRLIGYDDFAAAADYLAQAGWTDSDHLGIIGGSNGGLLVGAAMVRHPEKYRVAIPEVAVFDMLRHEKAGITSYWMEEYGTPEEGKDIYKVLMSYSPQHNLKEGVCYPSTLIKTSKRDDRVVPSHSYKFAAELQDKQSCDRPAFLYAAEDQGHSPNTFAERVESNLRTVAFALNEMGVKSVPVIENRPSDDDLKTPKWLEEEAKTRAKQAEEAKKRQSQKSE